MAGLVAMRGSSIFNLSRELLRYQSVMSGSETVRMTQFTGNSPEKSSTS
jgi:hypothetical protein